MCPSGSNCVVKAWLQDLRDTGYAFEVLTNRTDADTPERPTVPATVTGSSSGSRIHVVLVVAIVSARRDRRNAIRRSWLAWGDDRVKVRFFTEVPQSGTAEETALGDESAAHGDLVMMNIDPGMNFALKLVWAMRWMSQQFSFDFFLRLDDDYFLCLQRLLDELEETVAKANHTLTIYAGHLYCTKRASRTRIDEAYLLISSELVRRAMDAPDLQCGGHAGVTAGWWFTEGNQLNQLGDVQWVHDPRLDHEGACLGAPAEFTDICATHMGVHHTYSDMMLDVWQATKDRPGPISGEPRDASSVFAYADNGGCSMKGYKMSDGAFRQDHAQPCATFAAGSTTIHCGQEGC